MAILRVFIFMALFMLSFPCSEKAYAGTMDFDLGSSYDPVVMPELFSTSVMLDDNDVPPQEPTIIEIKFHKPPAITNISERVDRLLYGIKTDVPPEYDHYGYEIRRYMAKIGNLKNFESKEALEENIKNVKKAGIIAEYWKKFLEEEILEIEKVLKEDENIPLSIRSTFKQNQSAVQTFIIVLRRWIDSNETLMLHMYKNYEEFELFYPEVIIGQSSVRIDFFNNLTAKQTRLKDIRDFRPFVMMVY